MYKILLHTSDFAIYFRKYQRKFQIALNLKDTPQLKAGTMIFQYIYLHKWPLKRFYQTSRILNNLLSFS